MRGLLVRIGIDSTCGSWNAPVDLSTGRFVYVPIPESKSLHPDLERSFDELAEALTGVGANLPAGLQGVPAHLDPDFVFLTYGDQGSRARRIRNVLGSDDDGFIAFYAALRDVRSGKLIDALIGIYHVAAVLEATDVPRARWHENAHTRRRVNDGDVIVRAVRGKSGRLARCIVIGQYRDRAHRIDTEILNAWGGLSVKDGYIQRSARLPEFSQPQRFLVWLRAQKSTLITANNPP